MLKRALAQLLPDFESRPVSCPDDECEALQAKSAQLRLPLDEEPAIARRGRFAVMMGFPLHADTAVNANDREGLIRLIRYGARGPVAESRLSRRVDGRYAYETKRGVTLVLSAAQRVKRHVALTGVSTRAPGPTNEGSATPHSASALCADACTTPPVGRYLRSS